MSIEVTQADRLRAASFGRAVGRLSMKDANNVLAGKWDDTDDVQAFALHAAPLREALKPFAAFRLSTEGEVSDCVLRTPAAEARRHADAIENRDAQIVAARSALSPSYPMENYNGD